MDEPEARKNLAGGEDGAAIGNHRTKSRAQLCHPPRSGRSARNELALCGILPLEGTNASRALPGRGAMNAVAACGPGGSRSPSLASPPALFLASLRLAPSDRDGLTALRLNAGPHHVSHHEEGHDVSHALFEINGSIPTLHFLPAASRRSCSRRESTFGAGGAAGLAASFGLFAAMTGAAGGVTTLRGASMRRMEPSAMR